MPINEGQFNTEHHDEHGIEKPQPHPVPKTDAEHPGYEVTDVNAKGVVVFLGGLVSFLVVFFVLCYAMGKAINFGLLKQDGDEASTNPQAALAGGSPNGIQLHRGESLATNVQMEQSEAAVLTKAFPTPRLDADDSNQSTADLHAREDLLLDHYTAIEPGQGTAGNVRIPIDVAMQVLVKRGLPANNGAVAQQTAGMTGDVVHTTKVPLTNGFARTSYELDQIEERGQKMSMERPSAEQHASLAK